MTERARLTEDEVREMREQLSAHYGQNVAPAGEFCHALREWVRVMDESGYAPQAKEAWGSIAMILYKSNLAYRLVYLGEAVREEPCPKHKGHWSGCVFFDDERRCECMSGSNVTGWLPPSGGAKPDRNPPIRGVVLVPKDDGGDGNGDCGVSTEQSPPETSGRLLGEEQ